MYLKRISLSNFGIVPSFSQSFEKGVYLLSGLNGNGKSTIFKAVNMALFGFYVGSMEDYINWGSDSFTVGVDFSHMGKDYSLSLSHDRKKTTERILDCGGRTLTGADAQKKLESLLDPGLLRAAMVCSQHDIDIVAVKPAERREYLKRVYDLEFTRQIEGVGGELADSKSKATVLEATVRSLEAQTFENPPFPALPYGETERQGLEIQLAGKIRETERAKQNERVRGEKEQQLLATGRELTDAMRKSTAHGQEVKVARGQVDTLPDMRQAAIKSLQSSRELVVGELAGIRGLIASEKLAEKETLKRLDCERERLEAERQTLLSPVLSPEAMDFDATVLPSLTYRLQSLNKELSALVETPSSCPSCGREYDEATLTGRGRQVSALEAAIRDTEQDIADAEAVDAVYRENVREIAEAAKQEELRVRRLQETDASITSNGYERRLSESRELKYVSELSEKEAELRRIDDSISHQDEVFGLRERAANDALLQAERLYSSSQEQVGTVSEKKKLLEAELAKFSIPDIPSLEHEVGRIKQRLQDYDRAVAQREEVEKLIRRNAELRRERDAKVAELKRGYQETLAETKRLEQELKILKNEFPSFVISKIIETLEEGMNVFLSKTYGHKGYKIKVVERRGALHILYGKHHGAAKKEGLFQEASLASGYEQQIISLAFKCALSGLIGNRVLLLDEADSAADKYSSERFYREVANALGADFDQIFLITHKDSIKGLLEAEYSARSITMSDGSAS
jgi:DNA repair exonuclease SbcCD ATPase subunit